MTTAFKSYTRLLTVILLSIVIFTPTSAQDAMIGKSISIAKDEKGISRWRTSTGFTDFNIEYRGKIEVTDDDRDIKSISNDGFLEISKTVFGSKRRIVIESLGDGKVRKEYYEGRTKMEWEPNGRQWLGEILPEIVRTTTIGAEGRVERFYKKGGAQAVLSEIDIISSDYVKAHYGKLLLGKNISDTELPGVITSLGRSIRSDYYLASMLKDNINNLMRTPAASDAFFKATLNIGSDYYKAVVLKEALQKSAASPDQVRVVLQAAGDITSDYYLATVLTTLLENTDVKEESLNDLVVTTKKIGSDYYRTQVLVKALKKPGVSKSITKVAVEAVGDVSSDYYKSSVVTTLSETSMDMQTQEQVIALVANSMNSDYYAAASLKSMMRNQKLSDEAFNKLILAASRINSDHYASEVLREVSARDITKTQLIEICRVAKNIDSDHYLTTVLTAIAPKVRNSDNEVKDAYRQAAKEISSETYYGRAIRAID